MSRRSEQEYRLEEYGISILTEDDGSVVAYVPELSGCMAAGENANEAIKLLHEVFELWVADVRADGGEIPRPVRSEDFSGKVLVRMSKGLHARLAEMARVEGTSMNKLAVAILAEGLGQMRSKTGSTKTVGASVWKTAILAGAFREKQAVETMLEGRREVWAPRELRHARKRASGTEVSSWQGVSESCDELVRSKH